MLIINLFELYTDCASDTSFWGWFRLFVLLVSIGIYKVLKNNEKQFIY